MMRFTACKLGLAVAFAALAVGANAQPASNSSAQGTSGASPTAATKSPSAMKRSTTTKSPAKSHMASRDKATHRSAAKRGQGANAMESNTGDSAYRAALRRCVTGPASQRDSCLDDAIARYARA